MEEDSSESVERLPVSGFLSREKLKAAHFNRYSPQSRKMMQKMGFCTSKPQESGYGPTIPIPLGTGTEKDSVFRPIGCKQGLGAMNSDFGSSYFISETSDEKESQPESTQIPAENASSDVWIEFSTAPPNIEDGGQPTIDELEEIHLGTVDEPRPAFIAKFIPEEEKDALKELLKEFRNTSKLKRLAESFGK